MMQHIKTLVILLLFFLFPSISYGMLNLGKKVIKETGQSAIKKTIQPQSISSKPEQNKGRNQPVSIDLSKQPSSKIPTGQFTKEFGKVGEIPSTQPIIQPQPQDVLTQQPSTPIEPAPQKQAPYVTAEVSNKFAEQIKAELDIPTYGKSKKELAASTKKLNQLLTTMMKENLKAIFVDPSAQETMQALQEWQNDAPANQAVPVYKFADGSAMFFTESDGNSKPIIIHDLSWTTRYSNPTIISLEGRISSSTTPDATGKTLLETRLNNQNNAHFKANIQHYEQIIEQAKALGESPKSIENIQKLLDRIKSDELFSSTSIENYKNIFLQAEKQLIEKEAFKNKLKEEKLAEEKKMAQPTETPEETKEEIPQAALKEAELFAEELRKQELAEIEKKEMEAQRIEAEEKALQDAIKQEEERKIAEAKLIEAAEKEFEEGAGETSLEIEEALIKETELEMAKEEQYELEEMKKFKEEQDKQQLLDKEIMKIQQEQLDKDIETKKKERELRFQELQKTKPSPEDDSKLNKMQRELQELDNKKNIAAQLKQEDLDLTEQAEREILQEIEAERLNRAELERLKKLKEENDKIEKQAQEEIIREIELEKLLKELNNLEHKLEEHEFLELEEELKNIQVKSEKTIAEFQPKKDMDNITDQLEHEKFKQEQEALLEEAKNKYSVGIEELKEKQKKQQLIDEQTIQKELEDLEQKTKTEQNARDLRLQKQSNERTIAEQRELELLDKQLLHLEKTTQQKAAILEQRTKEDQKKEFLAKEALKEKIKEEFAKELELLTEQRLQNEANVATNEAELQELMQKLQDAELLQEQRAELEKELLDIQLQKAEQERTLTEKKNQQLPLAEQRLQQEKSLAQYNAELQELIQKLQDTELLQKQRAELKKELLDIQLQKAEQERALAEKKNQPTAIETAIKPIQPIVQEPVAQPTPTEHITTIQPTEPPTQPTTTTQETPDKPAQKPQLTLIDKEQLPSQQPIIPVIPEQPTLTTITEDPTQPTEPPAEPTTPTQEIPDAPAQEPQLIPIDKEQLPPQQPIMPVIPEQPTLTITQEPEPQPPTKPTPPLPSIKVPEQKESVTQEQPLLAVPEKRIEKTPTTQEIGRTTAPGVVTLSDTMKDFAPITTTKPTSPSFRPAPYSSSASSGYKAQPSSSRYRRPRTENIKKPQEDIIPQSIITRITNFFSNIIEKIRKPDIVLWERILPKWVVEYLSRKSFIKPETEQPVLEEQKQPPKTAEIPQKESAAIAQQKEEKTTPIPLLGTIKNLVTTAIDYIRNLFGF